VGVINELLTIPVSAAVNVGTASALALVHEFFNPERNGGQAGSGCRGFRDGL
jgi:hypothetical protein